MMRSGSTEVWRLRERGRAGSGPVVASGSAAAQGCPDIETCPRATGEGHPRADYFGDAPPDDGGVGDARPAGPKAATRSTVAVRGCSGEPATCECSRELTGRPPDPR